jgi:hypothetical protein
MNVNMNPIVFVVFDKLKRSFPQLSSLVLKNDCKWTYEILLKCNGLNYKLIFV